MFEGYDRAFSLLGIQQTNVRFGNRRGRRGGRFTTTPYTGWAKKDGLDENSTLGQSARDTRKAQVADKAREAYERDVREQITDQMQDDSQLPLTQKQKDKRDSLLEQEMKDYDSDPKKRKDAADRYRPELNSSERTNYNRNNPNRPEGQTEVSQATEDAVRDFITTATKEFITPEARLDPGSLQNDWDPIDKKDGSEFFKGPVTKLDGKAAKSGGGSDDESTPTTDQKSAEAGASGRYNSFGPGSSPDAKIATLLSMFLAHAAKPSAHHVKCTYHA